MSEVVPVNRAQSPAHERFAVELEARGVRVVKPAEQRSGPPLHVHVGRAGTGLVAHSDPASDRRAPAAATTKAVESFDEEMIRKGLQIDPSKAPPAPAAPRQLQPGFFPASQFGPQHLSGYSLAAFQNLDFHGRDFPAGLAKCRAAGLSQQTVEQMIRSERGAK